MDSTCQLSGKSRSFPTLYDGNVSCISRSFVFVRRRERKTTHSKATRPKSNGDTGSPNTESGQLRVSALVRFRQCSSITFVDNSSVEVADTETCCQIETVKIGKQDMLVYRRFLELEDLCLVVCHVCNQVVTPQGILKHYGSWGVVSL
ncbi:hypothetical protein WMY93_013819 [Mugilogobius chulae]|uniref:Uncharacterized protein n=1 Tax=Mugilogobius chulae TaxID=88201 RepID=A0AAW0P1C9_9GOBI